MSRPVRTWEGSFLVAGVLAGAGLPLAATGSPIGFTTALLIASAAVLAAGLAMEALAFLSPGTGRSRRHTLAGIETGENPDAQSNGGTVRGAQ